MRAYLDGTGCLMEHLRLELDDPGAAPCGRCSRCLGHPIVDADVDTELAHRALAFLRGNDIDIEPRKQWADLKRIAKERQVEPGKVLCQYGDGGWGERVAAQLPTGAIGDDLIDALATLVRTWRPHPRPTWVTAVPSLRRPDTVAALAAGVAAKLGLRYAPGGHEGSRVPPAGRDEQQLPAGRERRRRLRGRGAGARRRRCCSSTTSSTRAGRSRRSARLLREAGSGAVLPLALARGSGD